MSSTIAAQDLSPCLPAPRASPDGAARRQTVARQKGQARRRCCRHNGVHPAERRFEHGKGNEQRKPRHNGGQRAARVRPVPVQTKQNRPQKHGLQSAKGEKIDPHQQIGRLKRGDKHQRADHGRAAEAQSFHPPRRNARGVAPKPAMHVQILDDGRRGQEQHGIDSRHDCRERSGREHSGPERGQQRDRQRRHRQIAGRQIRKHRPPERARKVHAQQQKADDQRSQDHAVVHGAGILVRHAFLRGLGQAENAKPHQNPERKNHRPGHGVIRPCGSDQPGVDAPERGDALPDAAAGKMSYLNK